MSDFVWNCFVFHFPPNPVYLVCANSSIICLLKQILSLHPFWSLEIIILLCSICRQHKKKVFPKIFLHLILYSYFLVWVPAKRSHTWWNNKITSKKSDVFLKKKKIRLKIFPRGNIDRHLLKNFFWKLIACSTNEQKCVFGVWIRRINFLSGWDWIANSFSVEILLFFFSSDDLRRTNPIRLRWRTGLERRSLRTRSATGTEDLVPIPSTTSSRRSDRRRAPARKVNQVRSLSGLK